MQSKRTETELLQHKDERQHTAGEENDTAGNKIQETL